jgi:hypothetical protein
MSKQLFDDAIGEVPPSTIDVDAVVRRGRRAARLRRVANPVVAAGVAVVLLTGVVAYTLTRDGGGSGATMGTQPTTSASSQPSSESPSIPGSVIVPPPTSGESTQLQAPPTPELPEACKRTDLETAAQLSARLTAFVSGAVHGLRPDMQLSANMGVAPGRAPLEFYQVSGSKLNDNPSICAEDTYSMAIATTNGPEGAGNIMIVIQPSYYDPDTLVCDGTSGETTSCKVVTNSAGDVIRKTTAKFEGGTSGNHVDVLRADGTSIMITADNIGTSIKTGGAPTATVAPLALDQMVGLATSPVMTLFP